LTIYIDAANMILDGNVYYNVTLFNGGNRDVYMPGITVGDVILYPQGRPPGIILQNILRKNVFCDAWGAKSLFDDMPTTLQPGESVARWYCAVLPPP